MTDNTSAQLRIIDLHNEEYFEKIFDKVLLRLMSQTSKEVKRKVDLPINLINNKIDNINDLIFYSRICYNHRIFFTEFTATSKDSLYVFRKQVNFRNAAHSRKTFLNLLQIETSNKCVVNFIEKIFDISTGTGTAKNFKIFEVNSKALEYSDCESESPNLTPQQNQSIRAENFQMRIDYYSAIDSIARNLCGIYVCMCLIKRYQIKNEN
jgi:hypothetical protein